jgi:hypothetical protein
MATYINDLRLKEIATGDESGTWGTSTNTNLTLVADAFSYGTKQMASDANETFTMPDATADATRGFYLKITSAGSLTTTREVTLGPNTVSKVWIIENSTTGSQIITIKQGSGATVNIANGSKVMVVTDGAGAGAAVINANPTESGAGTVTSVQVAGGSTGLTYSGGPITGSGTITMAGTLATGSGGTGSTATNYCNLASNVTGTLPTANGGTGSTAVQYCNLASNVTGTLTFANGGSGAITPLLKGTSYAAVNRDYIIATAGGITITLPSGPSAGDTVTIKDGTGAAATTSFTVDRNSSKIASSATNLTFDKNFAEIVMTYINVTIGWSV